MGILGEKKETEGIFEAMTKNVPKLMLGTKSQICRKTKQNECQINDASADHCQTIEKPKIRKKSLKKPKKTIFFSTEEHR